MAYVSKKLMYLLGASREAAEYILQGQRMEDIIEITKEFEELRNFFIIRSVTVLSIKNSKVLKYKYECKYCDIGIFDKVYDKLAQIFSKDDLGIDFYEGVIHSECKFFNCINSYINCNFNDVVCRDEDLYKYNELISKNILMLSNIREKEYQNLKNNLRLEDNSMPYGIFIPTYKALNETTQDWCKLIYRDEDNMVMCLSRGLTGKDYITLARKDNHLEQLLEGSEDLGVFIDSSNFDIAQLIMLLNLLNDREEVHKVCLILEEKSIINWETMATEVIVCDKILDRKNVADLILVYKVAEYKFKEGKENILIVSGDSDFYGVIKMLNCNAKLIISQSVSSKYITKLCEEGITYKTIDEVVSKAEVNQSLKGKKRLQEELNFLNSLK